MVAPKTVSERAAQWVNPDVTTVDIAKCSAGFYARAVKPGGVCNLVLSIKEDGYKRVIHYSVW
jgi:hypothetical protein